MSHEPTSRIGFQRSVIALAAISLVFAAGCEPTETSDTLMPKINDQGVATTATPSQPRQAAAVPTLDPKSTVLDQLMAWNGYDDVITSMNVTGDVLNQLIGLAESGDSHAQFLLGRLHRKGWHTNQSDVEATRWFQKAADQGYAPGQSSLAYMKLKGLGTDKDPAGGLRLVRRAADQNYDRAIARLAYYHQAGTVIPRNLDKAIELHRRAIKMGNTTAMNNLAVMYESGLGVSKSNERAFQLYKQAADGGHARACANLAKMHLSGRCGMVDVEQGIHHLKLAIDKGITEAKAWLAFVYYEQNAGSDRDQQAYRLARDAAKDGIAEGDYWTGIMLLEGRGVEADIESGVMRIQRAADQNLALAKSMLGNFYFNGQHVKQNQPHAIELFKQAAAANCRYGQYSLGVCYMLGDGVEQKPKLALLLLTKAALQKLPAAFGRLGYMHQMGIGVTKDLLRAEELYEQAIDLGHADAKVALATMRMEGDEADKVSGFQLLKESAESGESDAYMPLGSCYYFGLGTQRNVDKAAHWLNAAANEGFAPAQYLLARIVMLGESTTQEVQSLDGQELMRLAARNGYQPADDYLTATKSTSSGRFFTTIGESHDYTIHGPKDPFNPTGEEWEWMQETHRENMRIERIERAREQGLPSWTVR